MEVDDIIYLNDGRICMKSYLKEYDIADHIQTLVDKLEKMKRQVIVMGIIDY